jgi:hypothetical protein
MLPSPVGLTNYVGLKIHRFIVTTRHQSRDTMKTCQPFAKFTLERSEGLKGRVYSD